MFCLFDLFSISYQEKEAKVLQKCKQYEAHAEQDPDDEWTDLLRCWDGPGCAVVQVDGHEEEGEEEAESSRDSFHVDGEADPADDNHQGAGDEVGVDVDGCFSFHPHAEPCLYIAIHFVFQRKFKFGGGQVVSFDQES